MRDREPLCDTITPMTTSRTVLARVRTSPAAAHLHRAATSGLVLPLITILVGLLIGILSPVGYWDGGEFVHVSP